jgi:kynureninase
VSAHALGLMSTKVENAINNYMKTWKDQGVNAWNYWLPLEDKVAEKISFLVGAFE